MFTSSGFLILGIWGKTRDDGGAKRRAPLLIEPYLKGRTASAGDRR